LRRFYPIAGADSITGEAWRLRAGTAIAAYAAPTERGKRGMRGVSSLQQNAVRSLCRSWRLVIAPASSRLHQCASLSTLPPAAARSCVARQPQSHSTRGIPDRGSEQERFHEVHHRRRGSPLSPQPWPGFRPRQADDPQSGAVVAADRASSSAAPLSIR
jgi:hypothetical protein